MESRKIKDRIKGVLKFFSPKDKYGFVISEIDNSDLFVHYDDLHKAGLEDDLIFSFKE